jgi:hypothetical protein
MWRRTMLLVLSGIITNNYSFKALTHPTVEIFAILSSADEAVRIYWR